MRLKHGTLARAVSIEAEGGTVVLRLTSDEAERLAIAIWAEYYIRDGLSRLEVRQLADAIKEAAGAGDGGRSVRLAPGIEQVENPRRPRPTQ